MNSDICSKYFYFHKKHNLRIKIDIKNFINILWVQGAALQIMVSGICPILKKLNCTLFWKYLVCGFKIEISEYLTKVDIVTYSPHKYEVNRTKTHEDRANQNRAVFFSPHCTVLFTSALGLGWVSTLALLYPKRQK